MLRSYETCAVTSRYGLPVHCQFSEWNRQPRVMELKKCGILRAASDDRLGVWQAGSHLSVSQMGVRLEVGGDVVVDRGFQGGRFPGS